MYQGYVRTRVSFASAKMLFFCVLAFSLLLLAASVLETWAPGSLGLVAAARANEPVYSCGLQDAGGVDNVFTGYETPGIVAGNDCGQAQESLQVNNDTKNKIPPGKSSGFVASAPAGLEIVSASVPSMYLSPTTVGTGYIADFYWTGGTPQRVDNASTSYSISGLSAAEFGFDLECSPSGTACPADGAGFVVPDIQLDVQETISPAITAIGSNNLFYKGPTEWVRGGGWPISFAASAPSGIYSMSASENGQAIGVPAPPSCAPDHTEWQQCPNGQPWSLTVALSGTGTQQLVLAATSAAGNTSSPAETIHVDSEQPTITLSGPTDASSAAGMQYVTAAATAGPSGVQGISCSLDNAPAQWYAGSSEQIPVSGIGVHHVQCESENNSYNASGQANWSAPANWTLSIRQPSESAVSFSRIADTLKCGRARERERAPAHWVTVRRHGKLVRVRRPARTVVRKVVRCDPRVAIKQICHAGHCRKQRVVLLPHTVQQSTWHARYGNGSAVSGWLGTSSGAALAGQQVQIMTAADDGQDAWRVTAVVTTSSDGTWSAQLRAGPSRLVQAVYGGTATVEPATSGQIQLIVSAKVKLSIRPRRTAWGGTIHIAGRVRGGYIPTGKLLRLRIGVAGVQETVGIPNIQRDGRFQTTWKFAPGNGVVRYWFSISTLSEADYPFAPASSPRVYVTVGPDRA
jgi:hypothetical protein